MHEYRKYLARFALYDKTGICKYLENKAADGWLLVEIGSFFWKFKRIEPQKLKFSVVYFKNASEYDPHLTESQLRFQEYSEYAGWEFAASRAETLVYYTDNENAVPIETDAVVEVRSVHSVMRRRWLLPYLFLVFSNGIMLFIDLNNFVQDPVTFLLVDAIILTFIRFVSMAFFLSEAVEYIVWYKRARKKANIDGSFLSTKSFTNIKVTIVLLIVLMSFSALSFASEDWSELAALFLGILIAIICLLVRLGVSTLLKKINAHKTVNYIITMSVTLAVILACIHGGVNFITEKNSWLENHHIKGFMTEDEFRAAAPLEISDFIHSEIDITYSMVEEFKAASADQLRAEQGASSLVSDEKYELAYTVFDIKVPFVRGLCVNKWFERYFVFDNFYDQAGVSLNRFSHREIAARVWSADEAYVLCVDGQAINRYLLCYGNKIVEFIPSWELTAEQVKAVAEAFA